MLTPRRNHTGPPRTCAPSSKEGRGRTLPGGWQGLWGFLLKRGGTSWGKRCPQGCVPPRPIAEVLLTAALTLGFLGDLLRALKPEATGAISAGPTLSFFSGIRGGAEWVEGASSQTS